VNKYPDLAEDELFDLYDWYKNVQNDTKRTLGVRRLARIEVIHMADEVQKSYLPDLLPTPFKYDENGERL